jgi:DNA topoisomerase II
MEIEDKYLFTTQEESVREKDWAAGSSKRLDSLEYVVREVEGTTNTPTPEFICELKTVKFPPALLKIIDEPIVNALDHIVRCADTATPVTYVKVVFEPSGWVKISNDGPGVEVAIHKVATEKLGRTIWAPTFIFGTLFQGSNRKKTEDSIIGGTNGIGAKLSNCFSTDFIVETVDTTRGLYFVQRWRNGMKDCDPPTIIDLKTKSELTAEKKKSHTTLAFLPDYKLFGYKTPLSLSDYEELAGLVLTRTIFASAYANFTAKRGVKKQVSVYYNDTLLPFKSMTDIAAMMFPSAETISTIIIPESPKAPTARKTASTPSAPLSYSWEVCVVLTDAGKVSELSNVNGVVVKSGKHTKYLLDQIVDLTKEKVAKLFNEKEVKFSSNYIGNNIFLLINAKIPNPSWAGQRKDVLEYDTKRFKVYKFTPKIAKQLAEILYERISVEIFNKIPTATGRKKVVIDYEKYRKANFCGTKQSQKCMLIPVEGDSAMNHIRTGISESIGFDYIGVISTGGVIMNARTKSEVTRTDDGQYIRRTEQLENNKFFTAFCGIVGLNHHYKYAQGSPTYKREMAELRYGCICIFVDQDLDGKGNILGSFISMFEYWWPELLKQGFVKWFCSPIIRAYPNRGGLVLDFYSTPEYEKWMVGQGFSSEAKPTGYTLKYYKGIGTHSRDEIIRTFRRYQQSILTYTVDSQTSRLFNVYFGSEPDLRKEELSRPSVQPTQQQTLVQYSTQKISCSDHLLWETNPYQKDNLERKLDHVIDGQNQSGRKILDGILKAFGTKNDQMKVAVLAGYISQCENYHHGEESLAKSITKKGFIGPGGKQLPQLFPCSNFGSRAEGGDDASPSRYIFGKNNAPLNSLLYPAADYPLLTFNFDEGSRSEPKYFVPIIPIAICESTEVPAHGWKIKTWARDVFTVIDNVLRMIRLGADCTLLPMRPTKYDPAPYNWTGDFRYIRGKLHSIGTAEIVDASGRCCMKSTPGAGWMGPTYDSTETYYLRITELPLREWTIPYIAKLKKKALSDAGASVIACGESIDDSSNDRRINIRVTLQPGAVMRLGDWSDSAYASGIEEFFMLRDHMDDHLNFMGADGAVVSLADYSDVMKIWFPVRKLYYTLRTDRELILLKLRLRKMENVVRYARDDELKLQTKKIAVMRETLTARKYDKINAKKLASPKFTPTVELTGIIIGGDKASFDYLLDLSDKAKSEEKILEYIAEIAQLKESINDLELRASRGMFRGAAIWEEELTELRKVITEGLRTEWKFGDFGKFTFD